MSQFKSGDQVVYQNDTEVGTVTYCGSDWCDVYFPSSGTGTFYDQDLTLSSAASYKLPTPEKQLPLMPVRPANGCECGASSVYPNAEYFHADYCPKYKRP